LHLLWSFLEPTAGYIEEAGAAIVPQRGLLWWIGLAQASGLLLLLLWVLLEATKKVACWLLLLLLHLSLSWRRIVHH